MKYITYFISVFCYIIVKDFNEWAEAAKLYNTEYVVKIKPIM